MAADSFINADLQYSSVWKQILARANPSTGLVFLNPIRRAHRRGLSQWRWDRLMHGLEAAGLMSRSYVEGGGRAGRQSWGQLNMAALHELYPFVNAPSVTAKTRSNQSVALRLHEWLDRDAAHHVTLLGEVLDLQRRRVKPSVLIAHIAENRPKGEADSYQAILFWAANRAALLYCVLTRSGSMSELARDHLGLPDTKIYVYLREWLIVYRSFDTATAQEVWTDAGNLLEGRLVYQRGDYVLRGSAGRDYVLSWRNTDPGAGRWVVADDQPDLTMQHAVLAQSYSYAVPTGVLERDLDMLCRVMKLNSVAPHARLQTKVVPQAALLAAFGPANFERARVAMNPCRCVFFDECNLRCSLEPSRPLVPCEDHTPLECEDDEHAIWPGREAATGHRPEF